MLNKVKLDSQEKLTEVRNEDTEVIQQEIKMVNSKLEEIKNKQEYIQGLLTFKMIRVNTKKKYLLKNDEYYKT